jgi:hypothetical protein
MRSILEFHRYVFDHNEPVSDVFPNHAITKKAIFKDVVDHIEEVEADHTSEVVEEWLEDHMGHVEVDTVDDTHESYSNKGDLFNDLLDEGILLEINGNHNDEY